MSPGFQIGAENDDVTSSACELTRFDDRRHAGREGVVAVVERLHDHRSEASATAATSAASSALAAKGFSQSTCLPQRARRASTGRGGRSAAGCRQRPPRGPPRAPRSFRGPGIPAQRQRLRRSGLGSHGHDGGCAAAAPSRLDQALGRCWRLQDAESQWLHRGDLCWTEDRCRWAAQRNSLRLPPSAQADAVDGEVGVFDVEEDAHTLGHSSHMSRPFCGEAARPSFDVVEVERLEPLEGTDRPWAERVELLLCVIGQNHGELATPHSRSSARDWLALRLCRAAGRAVRSAARRSPWPKSCATPTRSAWPASLTSTQ